MWDIYTIEFYSAIRKDETLPLATAWMDLESIMLSKISHRKGQEPYDFAHMCDMKHKATNKLIDTDTRGGKIEEAKGGQTRAWRQKGTRL